MSDPTHSRSPLCRVVKVGGSLLSLPHLESVVTNWWLRQPPKPTLLVIGGGPLADAVRELDRQALLDDTTAHWMAIRAMQVNSFVFRHVLSTADWVTNVCHWLETPATNAGRPIGVVAIEEYLRSHEPHHAGTPLPIGWHVTSDSIAARLAEAIGAAELVLLKSTLPPAGPNPLPMSQAVARELVDGHFPVSAAALPLIRIVNLRAADFAEVQLMPA